jgi:hypothetical protein
MKNLLLLLLTVILLAGCSPSNELKYTWKSGKEAPQQFKKIGVLAVLKSNEARIDVENGVMDALRAKGIGAVTTWDIWPFANNAEVVKKMGLTGDTLRRVVEQKVKEENMDGLIVIGMFDAFKEKRYVPGKDVSVGVGFGVPGYYPMYGWPYGAYVGYTFNTMNTPGYWVDASTYFTESNFYDIKTEQLLWTGQISTTMQTSLEEEGEKFGRTLVRGLFNDKVIVK